MDKWNETLQEFWNVFPSQAYIFLAQDDSDTAKKKMQTKPKLWMKLTYMRCEEWKDMLDGTSCTAWNLSSCFTVS